MLPVCLVLPLFAGCGGGSNPTASSNAGSSIPLLPAAATPPTYSIIPPTSTTTNGQLVGTPVLTATITKSYLDSITTVPTGSTVSSSGYTQTEYGTSTCDTAVYSYEYKTLDEGGGLAYATAALMVPVANGNAACSGALPIVEFAKGAGAGDISQSLLTPLIAYLYSSAPTFPPSPNPTSASGQGYIVIAPNFVSGIGIYQSSSDLYTQYNPYFMAKQNGQEMIDALAAGRQALTKINAGVSDNGKLYLSGFSEGGYRVMAGLKAMDTIGMPVNAAVTVSGPYAPSALIDLAMEGFTWNTQTAFSYILPNYEAAYQNIYDPTIGAANIYTPSYIQALVDPYDFSPSGFTPFDSSPNTSVYPNLQARNPVNPSYTYFNQFFSSNFSINDQYRSAYVQDALSTNPDGLGTGANPLPPTTSPIGLRYDLIKNDLRGYVPSMPVLLCTGDRDYGVNYIEQLAMAAAIKSQAQAQGKSVQLAQLDLDNNPQAPVTYNASSPMSYSNIIPPGIFGWYGQIAQQYGVGGLGQFYSYGLPSNVQSYMAGQINNQYVPTYNPSNPNTISPTGFNYTEYLSQNNQLPASSGGSNGGFVGTPPTSYGGYHDYIDEAAHCLALGRDFFHQY